MPPHDYNNDQTKIAWPGLPIWLIISLVGQKLGVWQALYTSTFAAGPIAEDIANNLLRRLFGLLILLAGIALLGFAAFGVLGLF